VGNLNKYGEIEDSVCPNCGGPVQPEWKACPACGLRIHAQSAVSSSVAHQSHADHPLPERKAQSKVWDWIVTFHFPLILIVAVVSMAFVAALTRRCDDDKRASLKKQVALVHDGDYVIANGAFLEAWRDEMPLVRVDLIIDRNDVDATFGGVWAATACQRGTGVQVIRPNAPRGWKSEYPVGSKWRIWGNIRKPAAHESSYTLTLHRGERL
jgi:hypothetical protein